MTSPALDLSAVLPPPRLAQLARDWLAEDVPQFDPAGACVGSREVTATLLCKSPGSVLAGTPFFAAVFAELGCRVEWLFPEGASLGEEGGTFNVQQKGEPPCSGVTIHSLHLGGWEDLLHGQLWACGSVTRAVRDARAVCGFSSKIEVECGSEEEGREAALAGADIVMLDNFKPQALHAAARSLKQQFPLLLIEASGGVTPDSLSQFLSPNVDVISLGCITQGCPVVDFSLKVPRPPGAGPSAPRDGLLPHTNGATSPGDRGSSPSNDIITTLSSPMSRRDFAF
uniref:Nicotinate-nucleotide pyrophosphorylase [carboxylating] n=1 Tax=Lepisosteus oculatus TaxID=7918 RepID=W5M4E2_LEPOC